MTNQTKITLAKHGALSFEMRGDIGVLTIDNPPVNAGSHAVRLGIVEGIKNAEKAGASGAVLLGAGRSFVAGPDLREFGQPLAWRAPIGWSGLSVSASWASGPLALCFRARVGGSPERCAA